MTQARPGRRHRRLRRGRRGRRAHRLRRRRTARRPRLPDRPVPVGGHQPPHRRLRRRPGGPYEVRRRDRGRRAARPSPPTSRSSSATRSGSRRPTTRGSPRPRRSWRRSWPRSRRPGVDAFHASTRRYWLPEFEGSDLNLAGWTKKLTGKPTITVGSVGLDGDFIRGVRGRGRRGRGHRRPARPPGARRVRPGRRRPRPARGPRVGRKVLAGDGGGAVPFSSDQLATLH